MAIDRPTFGGVNVGNISTGANEFSDKLMDLGFKLNAQDRLKQEDKLREEQLRYSRENDAFNRNRIIESDKNAKEERDYLLGQRKNKEDFMKSISEPGVDALDDTIIKRTNELAASKWNESNPISDAEASRLNDYYSRNEKILNPTLDPENLRSYIGSQALKYGVDPSTATSTYEMFKPDKKETGLTDMEKLLIGSELKKQEDVNRLNTEKALGNEKYDGRSGNTTTGAKKDKAGAIGSDFASNAAELNKLELDTDVIDALGATSEKEKALSLYTNLSKTYNPKDVANVIKASISSGGEINDDTVKTLLSNIPTNVSKSDASSTTGALEKVEYTPAIDLQSMIAKSTKVDKGKLAEDMFEREFGIPKSKSGESYSSPTSGAVDNYVPKSLPKEYESAYSSLIGKEGTDTKGKYVGYGQFEEKTATPYLQQLGKTWSDFKSDPYLQKEVTAMHMVDNAERLKKNDIEPNDTNLYMVHNLGEPTALKVLKGKTLDTSDYHKILNQLSNKEIGVDLPRFVNTAENKEKGIVGQIDITKAKAMVKTGELPAFDNIDASALWMNKFGKKDDYIENPSKEPFDVSKKDTKEQAIVDRFQEINKLYGKESDKAKEEKAKAKEDINRTFKLRDLMNSPSKAPEIEYDANNNESSNSFLDNLNIVKNDTVNAFNKVRDKASEDTKKDDNIYKYLNNDKSLSEKDRVQIDELNKTSNGRIILDKYRDEVFGNGKKLNEKDIVSRFLNDPESLTENENGWLDHMKSNDASQAELRKLLIDVKKPTEQMIQESKGKKIVDKMLNDENSLTADERRWIASMRINPNGRIILEQYSKEMKK